MRATQEPVVPEPEPPGLAEETLEEREAENRTRLSGTQSGGETDLGSFPCGSCTYSSLHLQSVAGKLSAKNRIGAPEPEDDEQGGAEAPLA